VNISAASAAPGKTSCLAVARPVPLLPSVKSFSDCEDYPAKGAAFNQVTQSISRFSQREGLSHDRFDGAGFEESDDSVPGPSPGRLRLSEQAEALKTSPPTPSITMSAP
jgi:hypothetical protein